MLRSSTGPKINKRTPSREDHQISNWPAAPLHLNKQDLDRLRRLQCSPSPLQRTAGQPGGVGFRGLGFRVEDLVQSLRSLGSDDSHLDVCT